ncbi:MAG: hypothetical protein ACOC0H_02515 [Thermodesulfobacteriota bacterium]
MIPLHKNNRTVQKSAGNDTEVLKPADSHSPFISYRSAYKSMTWVGGKPYVNGREERFQNYPVP